MTSASPAAVPLDQPLYGATFTQAIKRFFTKYATFSGRASRSEYWFSVLFIFLTAVVIWVPGIIIGVATGTPGYDSYGRPSTTPGPAFIPFAIVGVLFLLGVLVPRIAVTVRRLHDANLSGLLFLLVLIPNVGELIVFVMTLLAPSPAGARFDQGAVPLAVQLPPPPPSA